MNIFYISAFTVLKIITDKLFSLKVLICKSEIQKVVLLWAHSEGLFSQKRIFAIYNIKISRTDNLNLQWKLKITHIQNRHQNPIMRTSILKFTNDFMSTVA